MGAKQASLEKRETKSGGVTSSHSRIQKAVSLRLSPAMSRQLGRRWTELLPFSPGPASLSTKGSFLRGRREKDEGSHIPEKPGSFWAQCQGHPVCLLGYPESLAPDRVAGLGLSLRADGQPGPVSLWSSVPVLCGSLSPSLAQISLLLCLSCECRVNLFMCLFFHYCQSTCLSVTLGPWVSPVVCPWTIGHVVFQILCPSISQLDPGVLSQPICLSVPWMSG